MNQNYAIDPNQEYRFYPAEIRDAISAEKMLQDDAPYFIVKPLTASEAASVEDNLAETSIKTKGAASTMRLKSGSTVLDTLKKGLLGWGNFKLPSGEAAPWRDNGKSSPRNENFNYISAKWRREIAEAITEATNLSEQAEKNSD